MNIRIFLKTSLAYMLLCSVMPVCAQSPAIIKSSPYEEAITKIWNYDLIPKGGNGTLDPGRSISRSEFALILCKIAGFAPVVKGRIPQGQFQDVPEKNAFARAIETACSNNLMSGIDDRHFGPDLPVQYAEAVKGIITALGYGSYALEKGKGLNGYLMVAREKGIDAVVQADTEQPVTCGVLAQLLYNALEVDLMRSFISQGKNAHKELRGQNIRNMYLQPSRSSDEVPACTDTGMFRLANTGWDIWDGENGYFYGPTMLFEPGGKLNIWASSIGSGQEIDWIRHKYSEDAGQSFTREAVVMRPDPFTMDMPWACDPGAIKIGEYYYVGYTTFVARSKMPGGPYEKWNGTGWGGAAAPIIWNDGPPGFYGTGEPDFTQKNDVIFMYVTWESMERKNRLVHQTRVYTAPASDPDWPAHLKYRGVAMERYEAEDSPEVKYVPAYGKFIAVASASRFTAQCYIHVWESFDGISFRHCTKIKSHLLKFIHSAGISSQENGQIDINTLQFAAYSYGTVWGRWSTRIAPLVWEGSDMEKSCFPQRDRPADTAAPDPQKPLWISAESRILTLRSAKPQDFSMQAFLQDGTQQQIACSPDIRYDYDSSLVSISGCSIQGLRPGKARILATYRGVSTDFWVEVPKNFWSCSAYSYRRGWPAAHLCDGDEKTTWSSAPTKAGLTKGDWWCQIESPEPVDIVGLYCYARDKKGSCFPYDFKFQYSGDGKNFEDIPGQSYVDYKPKAWNRRLDFLFEKPARGKVFRMVSTRINRLEPFYINIAELGPLDTNTDIAEIVPYCDIFNFHYPEELKQIKFFVRNHRGEYRILSSDPEFVYDGYDADIIRVDSSGFVSARKDGQTRIRARYKNHEMTIRVIADLIP